MTHASVFSGIGGPEVAAAMLGWDNLFHCEINEFGRTILNYWFPNSKSYEDITKTSFKEWRGRVDVLTGGFPCQPFSYAGQRRGADDDRYLWPHMFRVIDEIRPSWVIAENVAGVTTMVEQGEVSPMGGQTSLFGEGDNLQRYQLRETFTIERICRDLESHGYSVQPVLVPACSVGAPHRRDRVFIVARRVASDTDNRADRRTAREDEGKGREERIQERNEVRKPDEPNQVRPEMRRPAADSEELLVNGGEPRLGGYDGGQQEPKSGGDNSEAAKGRIVADTDCDGLEHTFHEGADRGIPGTQGRGRQDGISKHTKLVEADGSGRTSSDTESEQGGRCKPGQPRCGGPEQGEPGRGGGEDDAERNAADTYGQRPDKPDFASEPSQPQRFDCEENHTSGIAGLGRWDAFPTVSPVHRGNDGIPFDVDSLSIPFSKWRTESLKAYGNAIVPQVMYEIFRFIEIVEKGGEE